MPAFTFTKATKAQTKAKVALIGISGSGKTYSALRIARGLAPDGRVAIVDTEHGSASKYSDEFEFDVHELEDFNPQHYIDCIRAAEQAGYDVLIIDSLSHAWVGKGGELEMVDQATRKASASGGRSSGFNSWRDVTPLHNQLIDSIVGARLHLIATMRAKTEYIQEQDPQTKKIVIRKVGLAPVQRDGMEYEFDVVGDLTQDHEFNITKSRCKRLADQIIRHPGEDNVGKVLREWCSDGVPVETRKPIRAEGPTPNTEEEPTTREERSFAIQQILMEGPQPWSPVQIGHMLNHVIAIGKDPEFKNLLAAVKAGRMDGRAEEYNQPKQVATKTEAA